MDGTNSYRHAVAGRQAKGVDHSDGQDQGDQRYLGAGG